MIILFNGYFYIKEKLRLERAAKIFLGCIQINKEVNLNFISLGQKEMCRENFKAFSKREVTDVVTLPIYKNRKDIISRTNDDGFVGDILIYRPEIKRNALEYGKTFIEELELVLVHGMLHLFGFTHDNEEELTYQQDKIMKKVWNGSRKI